MSAHKPRSRCTLFGAGNLVSESRFAERRRSLQSHFADHGRRVALKFDRRLGLSCARSKQLDPSLGIRAHESWGPITGTDFEALVVIPPIRLPLSGLPANLNAQLRRSSSL